MKINLKKLWLNMVFGSLLLLPSQVLAQLQVPPQPGGTSGGNLIAAINVIINWVLTIVGLIALIYLIYGGFKYIISGGDQSAAESAKNTILYAIIGLVVIGLSWVIVQFVIGAVGPPP